MNNYYKYEIVSKQPIAYVHSNNGKVCKVKIIGCDFDKRVTLQFEDGNTEEYKWGYVYKTYEGAKAHVDFDYKDCNWEDYSKLPQCINPWKMLLSNKTYSLYKKSRIKDNKETGYYIYNTTRKEYKTIKEALKVFGSLDEYESALLGSNKHGHLFEIEDNCLVEYEIRKGRFPIKSRHIGKRSTYKQWRK